MPKPSKTSDLSPEHLLTKAQNALQSGDILNAIAYFQLAVEQDPKNEAALIGKIRTLLRLGDIEEAARTCDKLRLIHEKPIVWALHEVITALFNAQRPPRYLNIGGGPFFNFTSWLNLESVPSPSNPIPTPLSPTITFPVENATIQTVYSSHCFEHLDDQTVRRCLREARRCLSPQGLLLIKIPNFDDVLKAWQNNNLAYFSNENWNYTTISKTWAQKGVADTIDARASMIFCGYWNAAYGDHFADVHNFGPGAYHGPATCEAATFRNLKTSSSPWVIAKTLREHVDKTEPAPIFSHRNAWSESEFTALLEQQGFRTLSVNAQEICAHFDYVPGIENMIHISAYYLAAKIGDDA